MLRARMQSATLLLCAVLSRPTSTVSAKRHGYHRRKSGVRCLGGEDDPSRWHQRSCLFTNVCYDAATATMVYHRLPDEAPVALLTSNGATDGSVNVSVVTEFPSAFVSLFLDDKWGWAPQVVDSPIPEEAIFEEKLHVLTGSQITQHSYAAGHMLSEHFYPMIHAMDLFALDEPRTRDFHFLEPVGPCAKHNKKRENGVLCTRWREMRRALSKHGNDERLIRLRWYTEHWDMRYFQAQWTFPPRRAAGYTCFTKLVVGNGNLHSMSLVHPAGPAWSRMIETVTAAFNVDPNRRLWRQRILLVNKGGRKGGGQVAGGANRIIEDVDRLASCVRSTFGVNVDVWKYNGESMGEQIAMASNYSVCITVSGGTAITCQFVPRGASAIYIGSWSSDEHDGSHGTNNNMEHPNWTWDWRHKTFAYPVMLGETRPSSTQTSEHPVYKYRLKWKHGDGFRLSVPRMALLVASALTDAEEGLALPRRSFRPLPRVLPAAHCAAGDINAPRHVV